MIDLSMFTDMSVIEILICIVLGYIGLKITGKIVKIACILGIGYFAMRFLGLI